MLKRLHVSTNICRHHRNDGVQCGIRRPIRCVVPSQAVHHIGALRLRHARVQLRKVLVHAPEKTVEFRPFDLAATHFGQSNAVHLKVRYDLVAGDGFLAVEHVAQLRRVDLCILDSRCLQLSQHLFWRALGLFQASRRFKGLGVVAKSVDIPTHRLACSDVSLL